MPQFDLKDRHCLKCFKTFRSRGAFNRICPSCAKVNARLNVSESQLQGERGLKRHNGEVIEPPRVEPLPTPLVYAERARELSA